MGTLTIDEKLNLITRNLQETIEPRDRIGTPLTLESILAERDLSIYWGTATTGRPHIAYFVPMTKIADFLKAGCDVTILFADLHALMDNMKSTWELLEHRVKHYEKVIKAMLKSIGVPIEKLRFVKGSDFQLSREYTLDVYKATTITTLHGCQKAGSEVVKQVENPLLSGMLYPLLQALDEEYLNVDAQFGGVDQRKIFTLAQDLLPKMGYKSRIHFMNPMVPGLTGKKMSASDPNSKIDILESKKSIQKKLRTAFCEPGNVKNNGLLSFAKYVGFPVLNLQGKPFVINRDARWGGPVTYNTYEELHEAFSTQQLAPEDLKIGIFNLLNMLLDPIRQEFESDPEWQQILQNAYPDNEIIINHKKPKTSPINCSCLDLRVGQIVEVTYHSIEPDNLYTVKINVGEQMMKSCIVNLVQHISIDKLVNSSVIVLCNLKPSKFKGVLSNAMILVASNGNNIEPICPQEGSDVGERVFFPGYDGIPEKEINNKKNNIFRKIQPFLFTNDQGHAYFKGSNGEPDAFFTTSKGLCSVRSVFSSPIQ